MKIGLAIFGTFILLVIGGVMAFVGASNQANTLEKRVTAQYDSMQVKLSEFSTGVLESIQIPEIAKNDLKELIEAGVQGRYGPDGAKNMFLSITEAYPGQLDPSLYTNIQNQIVSGRANFAAEQKTLVDVKRVYQTALDSIPGGFLMHLAGYPRIDLDDYGIITDERTQEIFKSGTDKPLQLGS